MGQCDYDSLGGFLDLNWDIIVDASNATVWAVEKIQENHDGKVWILSYQREMELREIEKYQPFTAVIHFKLLYMNQKFQKKNNSRLF